ARQVRKVRTQPRPRRGAANRVTHHARMTEKDLLAMDRLWCRWLRSTCGLFFQPLLKLSRRIRHHIERHMRMLLAAILRALAAPPARLIHLQHKVRGVSR